MSRGRVIKLSDNVFNYHYTVIISDEKYARAFLEKCFDKSAVDDTDFKGDGKFLVFLRKGMPYPIIWIPRKPETYYEYSVLCHEIIHCLFYGIRELRGIKAVEDAEEIYTYMFQRSISDSMEKIFGKTAKFKK